MDQIKYPGQVKIVDVGPRDGFQNVKSFIDTNTKLSIIDGLAAAGVSAIEVTSFVNPRAIPQMKDAAAVALAVRQKYPDLEAIALVPNLRGAANASEAGIKHLSYVVSASEAHNKANVNRTIAESIAGLKEIKETYPDLNVRVDIATAFGCPYAGITPVENVIYIMKEAKCLGIKDVTLCDTIGTGNPAQVAALLSQAGNQLPEMELALHMHNTRGLALANMSTALQYGVTTFETSIGGLGGCPFAPGSEGNAATEDAVYMFEQMNVNTGIDLERLLEVVRKVQTDVDAPVTGKMLKVADSSCINISGKAS